MGHYPETAIFSRFGNLNAQNLLYLQAELIHLQTRLRGCEASNSKAQGGNKALYARDWYWLENSVAEGDGEQWQTVLEIRAKLKEYSEFAIIMVAKSLMIIDNAIIQQAALAAMPEPTNYDLRFLQDWLERPKMGNFALLGEDRHVWGSSDKPDVHAPDLIVLKPRVEEDQFSKLVIGKFVVWAHGIFGSRAKKLSDVESGQVIYEDDCLLRFTSLVTTVVASLLPIVSIVVLYYLHDMGGRLGLIAVFTLVFALCLTGFSNAKTGEVFTATTA
jgi:hypothetical protein